MTAIVLFRFLKHNYFYFPLSSVEADPIMTEKYSKWVIMLALFIFLAKIIDKRSANNNEVCNYRILVSKELNRNRLLDNLKDVCKLFA